jgi:hypothetical protein
MFLLCTDMELFRHLFVLDLFSKTVGFIFYILLTVRLDILCNENQLDVLFILNSFRHWTSTYFGYVYAHHQEVFTLYVQQLERVIRCKLTGCWPGQDGSQSSILTRPAVNQLNPSTPSDLQRRRAVSPSTIQISSKKSRLTALRGGI